MSRKYLPKEKQLRQQDKPLSTFQFILKSKSNHGMHIQSSISKKYLQPSQSIYYANAIDSIMRLNNHYNSMHIAYKECLYTFPSNQHIQKYMTFHQTQSNIKAIILERVSKDVHCLPMHFQDQLQFLFIDYYRYIKKMQEKGQSLHHCQKRHDITKFNTRSQERNILNKSLLRDRQVLVKKVAGKESENASIRRLTRTLSQMVKKITDNKLILQIQSFHPAEEPLDFTLQEIQEQLKRQLENDISAIGFQRKKNVHTQQKNYHQQENYGLKAKKIKQDEHIKGEKVHKIDQKSKEKSQKKDKSHKINRESKQNKMIRIQTEYDCGSIKIVKNNKGDLCKKSLDKNMKGLGSPVHKRQKSNASNQKVNMKISRVFRN